MRKIVLYELLSLDGCAEDPGKQFVPDFDDVMRENLRRVIAKQDAVLLGWRSHDDWAGYWPSSDNQPFANFINNVAKFVVTSSPLDQIWTNTTVVGGELSQFVAELKQQQGGDIGVHGSISLAQSLLGDGLVDELRLVIAPAIHVRVFDGHVMTPTQKIVGDSLRPETRGDPEGVSEARATLDRAYALLDAHLADSGYAGGAWFPRIAALA
jgi:dihydrofolate reductase